MRIFKIAFVTMAFSICFFAVSSYGADVAKIGTVSFQKVLEKSDAGKKASDEINKRGKEMEDSLKKKGEEIDAIKNKLEREALVMSKEMREEKEREIRISINDFKTLKNKYMADFKEHEARLVRDIQKEVLEIVKEMGKKEGFLVIFEKREAGVLYSPDTIDITDRLIQRYNTVYSQKASKKK
ncbi:MAG: OmpH family outer membrane protein [Deltaproteobacteria bacterium]|jgi:outer membrane protein|nr:OmpH family outer membrane protein [Deltaproteobacteria bacterium]